MRDTESPHRAAGGARPSGPPALAAGRSPESAQDIVRGMAARHPGLDARGGKILEAVASLGQPLAGAAPEGGPVPAIPRGGASGHSQSLRDALAAAAARLEAEAARGRAVLEMLSDGVLILSADGAVEWLNAAAVRIHGFGSREEGLVSIHEYASLFEVWHPDGTPIPPADWACMRALRGEQVSNACAYVWRKGTAHTWAAKYAAAPLFSVGGGRSGAIVTIQDLTERERREREREAIVEQLVHASKMAAVGVMAAGIAHEVNNPNNAVVMNAPLLRRAFESFSPILDAHFSAHGDFSVAGIPYSQMRSILPTLIDSIADAGERIRSIVDGLKDYSRADTSGMDERIDVNDACRKAASFASAAIRKATDRFEQSYAPERPAIVGNACRIEQVVLNLLQNAAQALRSRDEAIRLSTSVDFHRGEVLITVADEGAGIPPEMLPRVGDPFFTTRRQAGGSGLGLSICMGIVRAHRGVMAIGSEPGRGTRVAITLPLAPGASAASGAARAPTPSESPCR